MTNPAHSFAQAIPYYEQHAHDQQRLAKQLARNLCTHPIPAQHILEIGVGTGQYTRILTNHWHNALAQHYTLNDLNPPPTNLTI